MIILKLFDNFTHLDLIQQKKTKNVFIILLLRISQV